VELESFRVFEGLNSRQAYAALAEELGTKHPPIFGPEPPQGWCSWYCFGPGVTAAEVMSNLEFIAKEIPSLRYIQIDDGYQAAMGDWLETGRAFGGDVRAVLRQIKERGFEPAIWVAPFIAERGSKVFQEHPEWFMASADGQPLAANHVTFGGWRHGPWYALDGSNPEVQRHLEMVFRTMREEWGVTYFKLDANFWGTMPQGGLHDAKATRIEAYRRGMEAIRRGAGDGFLLGCNHPLWPSLGLIHGSRSSSDISVNWSRVKRVARENLRRGWQNGRLWWNDPDVVLLQGDLTDDEFRFHATSIYASGGMLLAGDDLPKLPTERLAILRKLSPPTKHAAVFDPDFQEGGLRQGDKELLFLLNWGEGVESLTVDVKGVSKASDFWTDEEIGIYGGHLILELQAHGARLFVLERK
jgi:alpha-galactosidase